MVVVVGSITVLLLGSHHVFALPCVKSCLDSVIYKAMVDNALGHPGNVLTREGELVGH